MCRLQLLFPRPFQKAEAGCGTKSSPEGDRFNQSRRLAFSHLILSVIFLCDLDLGTQAHLSSRLLSDSVAGCSYLLQGKK